MFSFVFWGALAIQRLCGGTGPFGLHWPQVGKGALSHHEVWELIAKAERENRFKGRETLPILVVVGWAGNDVHGDFGYQGCMWIHQKNMNRTEADRKVAADYIEKQYQKVKRSLDGLVEISNSRDPRILSVQVIGNGDHTYYSLPPSYNRELGKRITWLGARNSNCVCLIAGNGVKYDNYHLHDHQYNRKLVYRFLRGAITFHLKYVEIMTKREQLRRFAVNFMPLVGLPIEFYDYAYRVDYTRCPKTEMVS